MVTRISGREQADVVPALAEAAGLRSAADHRASPSSYAAIRHSGPQISSQTVMTQDEPVIMDR